MHIDDQTYTVSGRTYRRVLLRNSYRKNGKVCHDSIANLSTCSNEDIAALKFGLANKHNLEILEQTAKKPVHTRQGLGVGAVWLLYQLAKRIGMTSALGTSREAKLCLWLVIAALMGSVSRLSATRLAQRHAACDILGLDGFDEEHLYAALDWLWQHQRRIEQRLFAHRSQQTIPTLYLYDVTSSYLEGDQNELGEYGYNRDKKRGKKQIVIGLLTDDQGRPISCEVFPGNTQDPQTFKSQIEKIKHQFGVIERVTFVGDRGMIKSAQIRDLGDDFHYITALTKPQIETLLKAGLAQMELFDQTVCELFDNGLRYLLRRNPQRAEEIRQNRASKRQKVVAFCQTKNAYLASHPRAHVDVAVRNVKALAGKLKINDWLSVTATGRTVTCQIDPAELKDQEKLDGCYVIKTDLPANAATKETIHDRYCDLAEVEWAFRTMKTALLHIRGIFVRTEEHTRAHVFTIMLAYLLAYELRRLWSNLELTIEEGIAELSSLCATEVVIGDSSIQTIPEPRPLGQSLLEAAAITLPDAIPCRHAPVFTRKSLVEERRTN